MSRNHYNYTFQEKLLFTAGSKIELARVKKNKIVKQWEHNDAKAKFYSLQYLVFSFHEI